jgi:2-keto-4-pentenoate hydratase/2-oxohepta-3-ene-1,7-dioic acid hydratase in catechol pathway
MKLVTFVPKAAWQRRIGAVIDKNRIVDLNAGYALYSSDSERESRPLAVADAFMPSDMIEFLEGGMSTLGRMNAMMDFITSHFQEGRQILDPAGRKVVYEMNEVTLKAPIPRPPGIGIGFFNDRGIIEEAAREKERARGDKVEGLKTEIVYPKKAAILWGHPSCVIGPDEPIIYPRICAERGPNVFNGIELGIIVGKRAYRVPLERAREHIAGYTVTTDITAYDLVAEESALYSLTRCKDMPTFWPIGPWIVSEDELGDPNRLNATVRINGKIAMTANTRQHIFSPYEYIRDLSEYMVLEPGTVIAMGSFSGTTYTFIKPGDIVENEIENIGVLRNPVVAGTE